MGWFAPRWRRREPLGSLNPPSEADLEEIHRLRQAGSRLDLPHPVRAFLSFADEAAGRSFMEALDREAVRANLRSETDGRWTVTIVRTFVPTPAAVTKVREELTALAETHNGQFVSWTAPPVY